MKDCGCCNVSKNKDIKGNEKYVTLDISIKFDSLNKMKITSSDSKEKLERSGKGLITSLGFRVKVRPHKYKKAKYAIGNVSKKEISNIIREFEKFEKLPYEKKRPKYDPNDIYFHIARQLAKFMMRVDAINWHGYGGYMEMTALSSNVCSLDKDESKRSIVNENLSQNYYADVENLYST